MPSILLVSQVQPAAGKQQPLRCPSPQGASRQGHRHREDPGLDPPDSESTYIFGGCEQQGYPTITGADIVGAYNQYGFQLQSGYTMLHGSCTSSVKVNVSEGDVITTWATSRTDTCMLLLIANTNDGAPPFIFLILKLQG